MDKYIMAIDQNGQPYIEHALFNRKRTAKKDHKYIEKIVDAGKARYFYTKAELDAYYDKSKAKVKDWAGVDKRNSRNLARQNKTSVDQIAERNIRNGTETISKSFTEKDKNKSDQLFEKGINQRNRGYEQQDKARNQLDKAQSAYDKTPLGRAENLANAAQKAVRNLKIDADYALLSAGKSVKNTASNVKKSLDDAVFEIEYAAEKVVNNITGNKDLSTRDFYRSAIEEAKKESLGKGSSADWYYNEYLIPELEKKEADAQKRYDSSLFGKLKSHASEIKEKIENINEPPKPVLSPEGEENIIKENVIKENVIKENVIKETFVDEITIPEDFTVETIIPEKVLKEFTIENIVEDNGNKVPMADISKVQNTRTDAWDFVNHVLDQPHSGVSSEERRDAYSLVQTMGHAEQLWLNGSIDFEEYTDIVNKAEKELYDKYGKYQKKK